MSPSNLSTFYSDRQLQVFEEKQEAMADRVLEKADIGALSPEQQEKLRQFKIKTRIANEKYLRDHPEVEMLLSDFLRDVIVKRPADIHVFAADHFNDPDLPRKIQLKLDEKNLE